MVFEMDIQLGWSLESFRDGGKLITCRIFTRLKHLPIMSDLMNDQLGANVGRNLATLGIPTRQTGVAPIQNHHGLGVALVAEGGGRRVVGFGAAWCG